MMFTHDEINLLCIFDTRSKQSLLSSIAQNMAHVEDAELLEIMKSSTDKLNKISNEEFSQIDFYPDYDEIKSEEMEE